MSKLHSSQHSRFIGALSIAGLLALVIGCGGGGGGGGSSTNMTAPTTTDPTTTTTDPTTTTTNPTTTSESTGGAVIPNKIFYTEEGSVETDFRFMDPDGSNDQSLAVLPLNYVSIAPSTVESEYIFAYSTAIDGATGYRLYTNTTPNVAGATQLNSTVFDFVGTIQMRPQGDFIFFVGGIETTQGNPDTMVYRLYRMSADGTTLEILDTNPDPELDISLDGSKIVYTKVIGSQGEIFARSTLGAVGAGTNLTNSSGDDWMPQWSKDGTQVVFTSDLGPTSADFDFDLYRMPATGSSNPTRITNTPGQLEFGGSFNSAGTEISFSVLNTEDTSEGGIFKVNANGTNRVNLKALSNSGTYTYWTPNAANRSVRGITKISLPARVKRRLGLR